MAKRHTRRIVIVTGASSGIGRRIAFRFAEEGAAIVCASPSNEPMTGKHYDTEITRPTEEIIESDLGGSARFISTDVSEPSSVRNLVDKTIDKFGGIDVLVNNAGIYFERNLDSTTTDEWGKLLAVDLTGTFLCSKFARPHLIKSQGDIINITSVNATEGGSGPSYAAAKAGQVNLTRDMAVELGSYNVTVNAISPGFIKTPIQDYQDEEDIERARECTPLPRLGEPEDVANLAVFLASDEASWITGSEFFVDGGYAARRS